SFPFPGGTFPNGAAGLPGSEQKFLPGQFQNRAGLPEAQSPGCASSLFGHRQIRSRLSPPPAPVPYCCPSPRMGGLQANSGGVSRVWSLPAAQVPVRPCVGERPRAAVQFQKPAPRGGFVSLFYFTRGESRLGVRPSIDNRATGGASARP